MLLLLLDECVPQNHPARLCYQLHVQILYMVMAPEVHPPAPQALTLLIELHHTLFRFVYPNELMTPKSHFYVHFPDSLLGYGPLRWACCLRFEAKHKRLSQLFQVGNHINSPKTFVEREERMQAVRFTTIPGQRPPNLTQDTNFTNLMPLPLDDPLWQQLAIENGGPLNQLLVTREATVDGTLLRRRRCVIRIVSPQPSYFFLENIITDLSTVYLRGTRLQVEEFSERVQLYRVAHTEEWVTINSINTVLCNAIMLWNWNHQFFISDRTSDRTFFQGQEI